MTAPVKPDQQPVENEPPLVTPGWYADPSGRHQVRYADEHGWTDTVSDVGVVSHDPLPPASRPPVHRRRRWWVIGGIIAAAVGGATLLFGIDRVITSLDNYHADLTKGSGDFRVTHSGGDSTFYARDGFHMVNSSPGWQASGVASKKAHTAVGVRTTVRAVQVPAGAAFGPVVFAANGNSFAFVVDAEGSATLLQFTGESDAAVVASGTAPALAGGVTQRLMLACRISSGGAATLTGYVDGKKVVTGIADASANEINATGMADYVDRNPPGEWVVSSFSRLGPDDLP
jgi:hypothetical protein